MPRLSFVAMSRDGLRAHRETKIVAGGSGLIVEESARLTFPNRSAIPKGVRRAAMGSALSRARTQFYQNIHRRMCSKLHSFSGVGNRIFLR